eukprot:TRINITY_DN74510_c0_g1_i1.p1 TRINITY_DN74510_c0_g1~~TRINITY_DN74510_c0_g1_i1.p1  ORF type:complete len:456 (+),score=62.94 TRINITY_DN74510_c0_g1_i1:56-1369(+)
MVPFLLLLGFSANIVVASDPCDVKAQGAVGDNSTDDTKAIQQTIDSCRAAHPLGAVVQLAGPATYRISASIALGSNLTIAFGENAAIFSGITPDMPIAQNPLCPTLYWKHGGTAILCGTNLTNVALIGSGPESSIVDGGGWPWYMAGLANSSMEGQGPRLYEITWSKNLTLAHLGFINSPSWTIHPTFCDGVLAHHIQILNPRFTPNTDGFDPDSCTDVVLHDSLIDTGDDGISVKSGNSTEIGSKHIQVPSRNIHIYRTKILSRNFCVGSATFGGVYDMVMEDCEVGDDNGSSSWAFKYKSHQQYPGSLKNHTYRRIRVGRIAPNDYQQKNGGYFMSIELRYHPLIPNRTCHKWDCPLFENIHFEDIRATGASRAGDINGFDGDLLKGLTFRNVTFAEAPEQGWSCAYVDTKSFSAIDVDPPLSCSSGPVQLEALV